MNYELTDSYDHQILRLALPSICANITIPLLGLADLAIMGHVGDAVLIGAIAAGSMIFNVVYWLFGFLRMGTSGLTAQAYGKKDVGGLVDLLGQSLFIALTIAAIIIILQVPILKGAYVCLSPSTELASHIHTYFNILIWGAPAVLALSSLTGWLIGMQDTRTPMTISILQNLLNILISAVLVLIFHYGIRGAALGTLIAQWLGLALCLLFLRLRHYNHTTLTTGISSFRQWKSGWFARHFVIHRDIFLRTLFLIAVNFFFLSAGSRQGETVLAANALLMTFFTLYSYFMDGFAYAGEALCGKYYGANDIKALDEVSRHLFKWGLIMIIVFTIAYTTTGRTCLHLLTTDDNVVEVAIGFLPWVWLVPLAGMAAFVYDGIFVGLTASRQMLISSAVAMTLFFIVFFSLQATFHNHALWLAFILFLFARGIVQHFYKPQLWKL